MREEKSGEKNPNTDPQYWLPETPGANRRRACLVFLDGHPIVRWTTDRGPS
ncbi:MAG: hypothetical protein ACHQ49_12475 [Elusimicrobiota bacterium]